jgi:preprotein translocase subunit SecE
VVSKTIGWEFESLHPCKFYTQAFITMSNIKDYINGTVEEMRDKVSWPTFKELQNSSILVLIGSLVFALVVGAMDFVFDSSLTWFYNQF